MAIRNFMYGCIALLALILSAEALSTSARAQGGLFRIIGNGFAVVGDTVYFLDTANVPYGWKALPAGAFTLPPVAGSNLAEFDRFLAVTTTGEAWGLVGPGSTWVDLGPLPGTPTVKTSWGAVKSKYVH